ncbi:Ivy family c-type lysozyme inhibitor [Rhizobium sp. PAMB 3182]
MKKTVFAVSCLLMIQGAVFAEEKPVPLAGQNLGEVLDKSEARRKVVEKLRYGIPGLPSWARYFIRRNDYVSTPSEEVEIGGTKYQLFHTCQPGNCAGMQMHILFSADGKQAWMRLFEKGKPDIFLGEPDEGQKKVLSEKNGL